MAGNPVTPVAGPGLRGPARWFWAHRIGIAAAVAVVFGSSTVYVVWAMQDLPDPKPGRAGGRRRRRARPQRQADRGLEPRRSLPHRSDRSARWASTPRPRSSRPRTATSTTTARSTSARRCARCGWTSPAAASTRAEARSRSSWSRSSCSRPQKSLTRKVHEMVLAVALEQRFSKDQILTMYLNRVYFGHGAYGIGAAARTYFSKDAKDLTPAQAAFLAGLIQAPSAYDPVDALTTWRSERELYVLQGMVTTSALSRQDAGDQAAAEDIKSELQDPGRAPARARRRTSSTTCSRSSSRCSARPPSSRAGSWSTRRSTSASSRSRTRRSRTA